jgi:hypothetical protein
LSALWVVLLLASLAGIVPAERAIAEERLTPRFDPFDRPSLQARPGGEGAEPQAPWSPWLKATLVAGKSSMANLGGVVLKLGEETHGFRLMEVREWEAVFTKDGERLTLAVVPPIGPQP